MPSVQRAVAVPAPIYVIELRLVFGSEARQTAAAAQLRTRAKAIVRNLIVPAQVGPYDGTYKSRTYGLNAELRSISQADRDQVWTDLDTLLGTSTNGPSAGSQAEKFDSNADDAANQDQAKYNQTIRDW